MDDPTTSSPGVAPLTVGDTYGSSGDTAPFSSPSRIPVPIEETPDDLESKVQTSPAKELENRLNSERDLPDPLQTPELPTPKQPSPIQIPFPSGAVSNYSGAAISTGKPSVSGTLKTAGIFVLLFLAGVGISIGLNRVLNTEGTPGTADPASKPGADISVTPVSPQIGTAEASGNLFSITDPVSKTAKASIALPESMLPPLCDGSACTSQGTYMAGGSRFTVSYRKQAKPLADFSQVIITDSTNKPFATTTATVSGFPAREFKGKFIGTTSGGYRFTDMHGFAVKLTDTELIEINHFAPAGITTRFDNDDQEFEKIISTFTPNAKTGTEKGGLAPLLPAATSSASATGAQSNKE